jgi:hypothetical protein
MLRSRRDCRPISAALCDRLVRTTAVVMVGALLSGCHVQTRLAIPGASPSAGVSAPPVKVGDEVRLTLRDGTLAGLIVVEVAADAIVGGRGQRYLFTDIATLERRRVTPVRTAGLMAGIAAGTLAAFTVLMLAFGWELDP